MPVADVRRYIEAPPEEVWGIISDVERAPQWVTVMLQLVSTTDNPVRLGATYRERSKVGPSVSETEWRITRFEPPRVQVHECNEPSMHAVLTMSVDANGTGTELRHHTEYQMMPRIRPLGWLLEKLIVNRTMSRQMTATVDNLVDLAESHR